MKAQKKSAQSLKSHGIQNSVNFGIKSSGLHHILGILRNQLYSDKVLAVLREYTCNGVDAHTQAGCPERPIEVTLPNVMNPFISIRDFGDALTDQEIQDVYAFYGESTKRNTNDQIGMLGIGSKAAFAYGDNFVINSFIDGKKHVYNAFIDPSQVGQISKLNVEDTDEENGIEIVVPIDEDDAEEFKNKAYDLFKWFKVRPIVKGVEEFKYDDKEVLFSGDGWKWLNSQGERSYYNRSGDAMAVMGNIGYPLDSYALNLQNTKLSELLHDNLVLEVPIGDLEISASREKLQYTDFTKKNLIKKLEKVQDDLANQVAKNFSDCETLFDAKCLYGSTFDYGNNLYNLRNVLKDKLKFKGKTIDSDSFSLYKYEDVTVHKLQKGARGGRYRLTEDNSISCNTSTVVIENDMGHRRGSLGKLLSYVFEEKKTVYLIDISHKNGKTFLKESGFDAKMKKLSKLEKRPLSDFYGATTSSGNGVPKSAKHSQKVFAIDWKVAENMRWDRQKSKCWEPEDVDIDNDAGIYVILDRFYVQGVGSSWVEGMGSHRYTGDIEASAMLDLKNSLKTMGVDMPKFYGIKLKQRAKVEANENMVLLWDWIKEKLDAQVIKLNLQQAYVDRVSALSIKNNENRDWFYRWGDDILADVTNLVVDKDGVFSTFIQKWSEMKNDHLKDAIDQLTQLSKDVGLELDLEGYKPTHDLMKLKTGADERYEMLDMVSDRQLNWSYKKETGEKIANYINVIDVCNVNG
jgi:hypothetical protein